MVAPLLALSVVAQSSSMTLSAQCQSALEEIVVSPEAQCLNPAGLVPIFLADPSTSLIGPIQTWLTGLCSEGPCTNQALATLVADIFQGCSSDLSSLGITSTDVTSFTASVEEFYPVVRQIACLEDNNANELCIIEELNGIQTVTGTLTIPKLMNGLVLNLPQNVTCNSCTKEAYNIIITDIPQVITSDDNSTLSNQCGAAFIDGSTPAGISETAAA